MPHVINGSRRSGSPHGSGHDDPGREQAAHARKQMEKMMKQMGKGKMPTLPGQLTTGRTEIGARVAVRMRLTRVGSKKNPIYRVVVADSRSPRDGRFIEIVGRYNPQTDPSTIELDEDKVKDWLGKGAQPSDAVSKLIKVAGIGTS